MFGDKLLGSKKCNYALLVWKDNVRIKSSQKEKQNHAENNMGYNDFHGQQEEYRKLSEVKKDESRHKYLTK